MRVEVTERDVHRYSSAAEAQAAHRERRARLFAKPAEPACVALVAAAQWLPDAPLPEPAPALVPVVSFVKPAEPSPLEKTILIIVDAVAAKLNLTAAEALSNLTSSTAQMARKLSAAVAVRRIDLSPETAADVLGIVRGAVLDGLLIVDPVLRDLAVPRTAPLADMIDLIFEHSRFELSMPRPTVDEIRRVVSAHFKIRTADINSARRTANVVKPRQIAMVLAKHLTLKSLPEIGRRFGGRDHTTVLHAVNKFKPAVLEVEQTLSLSSPIIDWVIAVEAAADRIKAAST